MPETLSVHARESSALSRSFVCAGLFGVAVLLLFHQTTWSMVSIWLRSDTFAHGFLILPISLWLVWERRHRLQQLTINAAPLVALLIIGPGLVWLLAWLVDVLVVQQLALVAILILGLWSILGHALARELMFPLGFLFFAVPMGEDLVPPMMEFTATSTVWLIRQTGIPVFREGLYFMLPSGHWSVVEACSGVRYLIASITLGVLFAYLSYRSFWRRAVFVLASIIVPILANSLRAYIIVMLGHMSDMKIATGVDHLIYGWIFFGLVMLVLFWVGSFFREDLAPVPTPTEAELAGAAGAVIPRLATALALSVAIAAAWPLLAAVKGGSTPSQSFVTLPQANGHWVKIPDQVWEWKPAQPRLALSQGFYQIGDQTVGLYIQHQDVSDPGVEVVGAGAYFVNQVDGWRKSPKGRVEVTLGTSKVHAEESAVSGFGKNLLVWSWYRIGDYYTANNYVAKLLEAGGRLGVLPEGAYRIVIATPAGEKTDSADAVMRQFLQAHQQGLEASVGQRGPGQ